MRRSLLTLLLLLSLSPLFARDLTLRFRADGTFKIAQFTDLHIDPRSDHTAGTYALLREVIRAERPDLVLVTGDVITEAPAAEGWRELTRFFAGERQPYAVLLGNHDAEKLSKDSIFDILEGAPCCLSRRGPADIHGRGNQELRILASAGGETPAALLYLLDSNQYYRDPFVSHYDIIHFDQIARLRQTHRATLESLGVKGLPTLLFFHIPLPEYAALQETGRGHLTEGVSGPRVNSGLFSTLLDLGDVMGVFCGHDHANDAIGICHGIALGYGRVSGLDAYGSLPRGARIVVLHEGEARFDSYLTTPEGGREETFYYPSGFTSEEERTAAYLPALAGVTPRQQGVRCRYYTGPFKSTRDLSSAPVAAQGILPYPSIEGADREDHFGYIFEALIDIPERGLYRFYTYSDDGSVLLLDGVPVVNNDGGHSARLREGIVALDKGLHRLRIDYFEDYMGQTLEAGFASKRLSRRPLPPDMLRVE